MEMMWRHGSQFPFRVNFNLKLSQKTSTATQLYNIPSFILLPNLKYRGETSPIYTIKLDCEGTTDDARCDVETTHWHWHCDNIKRPPQPGLDNKYGSNI